MDEAEASDKDREKEVYARAIKLLARREHTRHELQVKLGKAGFEEALTVVVLDKLVEKGFQSDLRFAELYVEQRFNKGYGERDIRAKLLQRGIDRQMTDSALAEFVMSQNIDWYEHATRVLAARFNLSADDANYAEDGLNHDEHPAEDDLSADDRRQQARDQAVARQRIRKKWGSYLLRRGFSNDQVISAIDHSSAVD